MSHLLKKNILGTVGTYMVADQLARRGFVVSALSQTAKGIDILAADAKMRPVAIQVKTNQTNRRAWPMKVEHERVKAPGMFYVFVRTGPEMTEVEFYVVPSTFVARYLRRAHKKWENAKKTRSRNSSFRLFRVKQPKRWLDQWGQLGEAVAGSEVKKP